MKHDIKNINDFNQYVIDHYPKLCYEREVENGGKQLYIPCGACPPIGWYKLVLATLDCICDYCENEQKNINWKNKPENKQWRGQEELLNDFEWPKIAQIKSKFAGLRLYIDNVMPDVRGMINLAESMSYTICEETGADGVCCKIGGWYRTLSQDIIDKLIKDGHEVEV